MKINNTKMIAAIVAGTTIAAQAGSRPDAHAPIGVLGDHTHKKGELMASYRFMTMEMNQIFSGSHVNTGPYNFIDDFWSWGAQARAIIHTGTNDVGYTLGDSMNLTSWVARKLNANFSVSGRVNFNAWSGYDGVQNNGMFEFNPKMASPTDPENFGGTRTDLLIGLN